jgi:hypothetical protein
VLNTPWVPGRRVYSNAVAVNDFRHRYALVPPSQGLRRDRFRLRKAYVATGRLGPENPLDKLLLVLLEFLVLLGLLHLITPGAL